MSLFHILITVTLFNSGGASVSTQLVPYEGSTMGCEALARRLISEHSLTMNNTGALTRYIRKAECIPQRGK